MNVVIDGKGSIIRRPGIADFEPADATIGGLANDSKVLAMHVDGNGVMYVAQQIGDFTGVRSLFRFDKVATRAVSGVTFQTIGDRTLLGSLRPVFAETEAMIAVAGGNTPQKVEFASIPPTLEVLGGSPPKASHIIAHASRLVCNDLDNRSHIRFSGTAAGTAVAGHETWSATGFVSAEARPDPVVALWENTDEVFAYGKTNLQVFSPDALSTYAPVGTREYGLIAPYSIIKVEQKFAWLDGLRRFVISDGREAQFLSTESVKGTLDDMSTVDDCFGYRVTMGPIDVLVWTFPTAKVTLCFQVGGGWSQWGTWDSASNSWGQFLPTCHTYNAETQEHYVGGANGTIGVLTFSSQTDRADPDVDPTTSVANSPTTIPAFVETGAVHRGTNKRKWSKSVTLGIRRGDSTAGENPIGHIQYRDDNGPWSGKIPIRLGGPGDTNPVVRPVTGMGVYRYRQWRLWFDGSEPFTLVRAEEEFEVLEV